MRLFLFLALGTQIVLFLPELPGHGEFYVRVIWVTVASALLARWFARLVREKGHILLARLGLARAAAPASYVRALFDDYARDYDEHLTRELHYAAPAQLRALVVEHLAGEAGTVADLGCGTGLCGIQFRDLATKLVGVDLSARMLQRARARACYDQLVEADVVDFLQRHEASFALLVAADVLVYIGDLASVFAAATAALQPGGGFAFTVESTTGSRWRALPSGRYAHPVAYVQRLAAQAKLEIVARRGVALRTQHGQAVAGEAWLLRKPLPLSLRGDDASAACEPPPSCAVRALADRANRDRGRK